MKARMIWNEHQQKWLMQKWDKIANDWVFIYDFWDCGNIRVIFNLMKKEDKDQPHYYEMTIKETQ